MLTEFLCSSAGERACTVPWICENWRLVLMISADWNRRDLEGERCYQVNWDAVFWYWFFFSIFFLFIFSYIVEEKTSLQMPLFPTLARYTFFLAFFKFWNSSQPILLRANFWLQGNGLAHQTWFHFCPALRAAWHSFISGAWVIYQPELFLTCLRPAFHLCSSAFD